jgi:hypothetical protein
MFSVLGGVLGIGQGINNNQHNAMAQQNQAMTASQISGQQNTFAVGGRLTHNQLRQMAQGLQRKRSVQQATPWQNDYYSREEFIMAIGQKCDTLDDAELTILGVEDMTVKLQHKESKFRYGPYMVKSIPFIDELRKKSKLFKLVSKCP